MMLTLGEHPREGEWRVPIRETIAARGEGVAALTDTIEEHLRTIRANGGWERRERAALLDEVRGLVRARVVARVSHLFREEAQFERALQRLVLRSLDPVTAAEEVATAAAASLARDEAS